MVFDVSNGFELKAKVSHLPKRPQSDMEARGACGTWWSASTSNVERSLFVDHYVLSVSRDEIKVSDLDNRWRILPSLSLN
jgi:hypothetical protein